MHNFAYRPNNKETNPMDRGYHHPEFESRYAICETKDDRFYVYPYGEECDNPSNWAYFSTLEAAKAAVLMLMG